jgi:glutamine cyclotransferase
LIESTDQSKNTDIHKTVKNFPAYLRRILFASLILALLAAGYQIMSIAASNRMPEQLVPRVISVLPHDPSSFTQGLLWHNGSLYESTGHYGQSSLLRIDPQTGVALQRVDNPANVFGEGIALDGNRLFQLTWRENIGYIYDVDTLAQMGTVTYEGEGWGLCFDGKHFYMSNGSDHIFKRDPQRFAVVGSFQVMLDDKPISELNELECVGNSIYANVWKTNTILRIHKGSGRVTGVVDASGLLTSQETNVAGPDGVLNGIAYDPRERVFFITGKLWPKLFEVTFVPKAGD